MTVERLEELKAWVQNMKRFGVHEGNDTISLIDAEIEREKWREAEMQFLAKTNLDEKCEKSPSATWSETPQ